jgi:GDP-L-fucose synthase
MILVTGGNGMVGTELKKIMPQCLYPSSKELNLLSEDSIKNYFNRNRITSVIHLAAHVGSLHDNIENRVKYFDNNVIMNTLITRISHEFGVNKFIGILSTCIYPDLGMNYPMVESSIHLGAPHDDLYSYAYAKRCHAVQIDAYKKQFGVDYSYLIPTNLYGYSLHFGRLHFVNDMVLKILNIEKYEEDFIELFGDGTPLRQFMFAEDFARFIKEYFYSNVNLSMNVGDPVNRSIQEMTTIGLSLRGLNANIKYNNSKPNGQFRKDVDVSLMRKNFPDFVFTSFSEGLEKLFKFYEERI